MTNLSFNLNVTLVVYVENTPKNQRILIIHKNRLNLNWIFKKFACGLSFTRKEKFSGV